MNYEEILQTVRGFCVREKLLDGKKHLALAVSGGADSMALLCLMRPLAGEKGIALTVCHVNHGLRGETADRDEAFVREVCARLGLPLRVFHAAELEAEAGKPRAGEDWARRLRYACFERVLAEGIDAVATAHTGSDQAETLLFRLARGTGLHGAAGIRPSRPGYLRPLLCLTRADTEAVCRVCGERWVTDETNDADDYARNRLRHGALPALCGVNSAAERNLARFCEKAAKADEYFARQADALLASARATDAKSLPGGAGYALRSGQPVWMSEPLRQTDPLILDMALHSLVEPVRDAEEKYIRLLADLVEKGSGAVQLTDAVRFCARDGVLWREEADKNTRRQGEKADCPKFEVSLPEGGDYPLPGGRKLHIRVVSACFEEKTQGVHKKDLKNQADYAKINSICPVLRLRCRQPGDRFRPAGRGVDRELRKWMNEAGIPPRERDTLPLLAAGQTGAVGLRRGLCRWAGSRAGHRAAAAGGTRKFWRNRIMSMNDDILKVLVSEEELKAKVAELGAQISKDYEGRNLVLVSILKGSVVFMADLMRAVSIPCSIDFMVVSSYGGGNTTSTGLVKIIKDLDGDLSGKDVLIVEDILDTGITLSNLVPMLKMRNPNSVKICTILDKPSRRKADIAPDYEGFAVPDEFVVGYGLDYDEKYRNLPYIGVLKPSVYEK